MSRYLKSILKIVGIYFVVLVGYLAFSFASISSTNLAKYERKLNPSTFTFWQNGEFYVTPPLFSETLDDTLEQLSDQEPSGPNDVDIWVLLLNGPEDITSVTFAPQLGIDVSGIASRDPGLIVSYGSASLKLRKHIIPFYVKRRKVLILDASEFQKNNRSECIDDLVYGLMIDVRDQTLWEQCKVT